ncbi:MAG: adenosylmethionine--8-amino-7-oxononanoate transaminase [Thermodesulfobacteriota bacterium]
MNGRKALWHPCTQMQDLERRPPLRIARAEGVYLHDSEGKAYIDAVSSWWVNTLGHRHPRIMAAIKEQAERLDQVILANCTHDAAEELAAGLLEVVPPGLGHVLFACDGSSAVEMALKLAYGFFRHGGQAERRRFAYVSRGYHGDTAGCMAVCGDPYYAAFYKDLFVPQVELPGPDCLRCPAGKTRETCAAECFGPAAEVLERRGQELAGVIVEPLVQCAGGFKMHPPAWLARLAQATREVGALFILDEIATGFGRTGTMFAAEQAGVSPDLMCVGKGLTAGSLPLSATLAAPPIFEAHYGEFASLKAFLHSHSFTGNALACAAAVENLRVFKEEAVAEASRPRAAHLARAVRERFAGHPRVGEVRTTGFITAVEFVQDRATLEPFPWRARTGFRMSRAAIARGALLRNLGDVLYFMPPYCITGDEIEKLADIAREAVREVLG